MRFLGKEGFVVYCRSTGHGEGFEAGGLLAFKGDFGPVGRAVAEAFEDYTGWGGREGDGVEEFLGLVRGEDGEGCGDGYVWLEGCCIYLDY